MSARPRGLRRRLAQRLLAAAGLAVFTALPAAAQGPLLWEVRGPATTHHFAGSMHLLPPGEPLAAPVEAAYRSAAEIVFETDLRALLEPEAQAQLLAVARESHPQGLRGRIGDEMWQRLAARSGALGVPPEFFQPFQPWFAATTLEVIAFMKDGFAPEGGLDQRLYALADRDAKPISWLEAPGEHMRLLTAMPGDLSVQFLESALDERQAADQSPEHMLRVWRGGDLAALSKMMEEFRSDYPGVQQRLMGDRNRAWVPLLKAILDADRPHLVVVGAAHFVGDDGLLVLLSQAGYELRLVAAPAAVESPAAAPPAAVTPAPAVPGSPGTAPAVPAAAELEAVLAP